MVARVAFRFVVVLAAVAPALAGGYQARFENPPFVVGLLGGSAPNLPGQDGWLVPTTDVNYFLVANGDNGPSGPGTQYVHGGPYDPNETDQRVQKTFDTGFTPNMIETLEFDIRFISGFGSRGWVNARDTSNGGDRYPIYLYGIGADGNFYVNLYDSQDLLNEDLPIGGIGDNGWHHVKLAYDFGAEQLVDLRFDGQYPLPKPRNVYKARDGADYQYWSKIQLRYQPDAGTPGEWGFDNIRLGMGAGRGDMNCDGAVNFGDINPFVLALTGQAGYEAAYPNCWYMNADINGDGAVNFGDINPFVALLTG